MSAYSVPYSAAFYVRILKCTNESHRFLYTPLLLLKHIFRQPYENETERKDRAGCASSPITRRQYVANTHAQYAAGAWVMLNCKRLIC